MAERDVTPAINTSQPNRREEGASDASSVEMGGSLSDLTRLRRATVDGNDSSRSLPHEKPITNIAL